MSSQAFSLKDPVRSPDPVSSHDAFFFKRALKLASRGLGTCWPNPSVGAVVVADGPVPLIVGEGWTQQGGRPHGETVALDMAGEKANGATVYVSLEPCAHHGKTPPCTDALIASGVSRIVYGLQDPDPRVAGRGYQRLSDAGIQVDQAPEFLLREAAYLSAGHLLRVRAGRPFIQVKIAVGSDGLILPGDGQPRWVTGELARAQGHMLRATADAILVGKGTVLADNPSLTCRLPGLEGRSPIRVVLDRNLEIPLSHTLVETAKDTPVWIYCSETANSEKRQALETKGVVVVPVAEDGKKAGLDLRAVLGDLAERGITRVLVEGGPTVTSSLLKANHVDEVIVFQGRRPAGKNGLSPVSGASLDAVTEHKDFERHECRSIGPDQFRSYRRRLEI